MNICIVGPTCSGKTTIAKFLEENYNFDRVITYTTRPPREGEKDGVDYFFVSDEEFDKLKKGGFFLETTSYSASFGECKYGTPKKPFMKDGDHVIVLNIEGAINFVEQGFGKVVYIIISRRSARKRAFIRGDNMDEFERRYTSDMKDYVTYEFFNYTDAIYHSL